MDRWVSYQQKTARRTAARKKRAGYYYVKDGKLHGPHADADAARKAKDRNGGTGVVRITSTGKIA